MKILIQGGRVIDPATQMDAVADVAIAGGKILAIGGIPADFVPGLTVDAKGCVVAPGLVDLSVRLREPGHEHEGMLASEMAAAVAGGVTSVVCPPDTDPVLDEPGLVEMLRHRAERLKQARVLPLGALTRNLQGEVLTEMLQLTQAGCVAFSQAEVLAAVSEWGRQTAVLALSLQRFEAAGGDGVLGGLSMVQWLAKHARMAPQQSVELLGLGRFLDECTAFTEGLFTGQLSLGQVHVARRLHRRKFRDALRENQHELAGNLAALGLADTELVVGEWKKAAEAVLDDGTAACLILEKGEDVISWIKLETDGIIEDAKFKTYGCGSAIASSSLVTEWVKGKSLDEASGIRNTQIAEELALPPVKIHCSILAEDAIKAAIADYRKKYGEGEADSAQKAAD